MMSGRGGRRRPVLNGASHSDVLAAELLPARLNTPSAVKLSAF